MMKVYDIFRTQFCHTVSLDTKANSEWHIFRWTEVRPTTRNFQVSIIECQPNGITKCFADFLSVTCNGDPYVTVHGDLRKTRNRFVVEYKRINPSLYEFELKLLSKFHCSLQITGPLPYK